MYEYQHSVLSRIFDTKSRLTTRFAQQALDAVFPVTPGLENRKYSRRKLNPATEDNEQLRQHQIIIEEIRTYVDRLDSNTPGTHLVTPEQIVASAARDGYPDAVAYYSDMAKNMSSYDITHYLQQSISVWLQEVKDAKTLQLSKRPWWDVRPSVFTSKHDVKSWSDERKERANKNWFRSKNEETNKLIWSIEKAQSEELLWNTSKKLFLIQLTDSRLGKTIVNLFGLPVHGLILGVDSLADSIGFVFQHTVGAAAKGLGKGLYGLTLKVANLFDPVKDPNSISPADNASSWLTWKAKENNSDDGWLL